MQPTLIPRRVLFGNPVQANTQISPDGRFLSWVAPVDGVLNLFVAPRDQPSAARAVTSDRKRGVRVYAWTYDGHGLVYVQDEDGNEDFHLYALDPDTLVVRDLTPFAGIRAFVLNGSRQVRDKLLVALNRRDPRYHDVCTVDLVTGAIETVQENDGYLGFVADQQYQVHMALKLLPDGSRVLYRRDGEGWAGFITFGPDDARASGPSHLSADGSALFLRDSRGRDTAALVRLDLAGGGTRVLAADDRADIGGMIVDPATLEPMACTVRYERTEYKVLDDRVRPDLDRLLAAGLGEIAVTSRTEDDRLWIVSAYTDRFPGGAFLYDRDTGAITKLAESRPDLKDAPVQPMRAVTIPARDGLGLVCYLTRPDGATVPGPMVLVVHGGPWARDAWGFNGYHAWLADRGYAVLSVNFRGSTGFGKGFVNAGDREWGRRMDDDLLDAIAWAVAEGVAEPSRIAIFGASYGGYAVLAGMTRNPDLYACGVDIVGPSNLETLIATIPPYWEAMRTELTKAVGDPATPDGLALMRERSPLHQAGRIRRPLLIAQGANDPRVKQAESDQMVAALQANGVPVSYVLFPDEGHGFVRPENSLAFKAVAEAFLARYLGGRAEPVTEAEIAASTMQVPAGREALGLP